MSVSAIRPNYNISTDFHSFLLWKSLFSYMELQKIERNVPINNIACDVAFIGYRNVLGHLLKIHVVVGRTESLIDDKLMGGFSSEAMKLVRIQGQKDQREPKLVVSLSILVGSKISSSGVRFARRTRITRIGEREIPLIYDLDKKRYHTFRWYNFWGFLHASFYLSTIKAIISQLEKNNFILKSE